MTTAPSPIAQYHLEQALSWMIRECQDVWDELPKEERALYMAEYRVLFGLLRHARGKSDPVIPSPWTDDEVADSMACNHNGSGWWYSSSTMLMVTDSRLVHAVRVAQRSRSRTPKKAQPPKGKPPRYYGPPPLPRLPRDPLRGPMDGPDFTAF
jgi:hypothetical protein